MSKSFHEKPNMYISHVQLKVSNLQISKEFYKSIIGFSILEEDSDTVYFTTDGNRSILSITEVGESVSNNGNTGLYHFAILLPTRKDLGNIIRYFMEHKIKIDHGDHHVSQAIYLSDPDGNGIEIYVDRPKEQWRWIADNKVYMTTEPVNIRSVLSEADGAWVGLPRDTVMGHVHLSASDLDETEKFHTEKLGYEVVNNYGGSAIFLSTGKYHHHLAFNIWGGKGRTSPPENAVGLKSYTIVLKDEDAASLIKEKLQADGNIAENYPEAPTKGGKQKFSTVDPNGIRIIFTTESE